MVYVCTHVPDVEQDGFLQDVVPLPFLRILDCLFFVRPEYRLDLFGQRVADNPKHNTETNCCESRGGAKGSGTWGTGRGARGGACWARFGGCGREGHV